MKKLKTKFAAFAVLACAIALSGCSALKAVQEVGGGLAERQCEKSPYQRKLERLGVFVALDGKAAVKVCCPGEECYQATEKAAKVALEIFNDLQNGDYQAASRALYESASQLGLDLDAPLDKNGCFPTKNGISICFQSRAPPEE